jgi:hypothetical protein
LKKDEEQYFESEEASETIEEPKQNEPIAKQLIVY